MPPEAHIVLAWPAKHDYGDFMDFNMARVWLEAQRRYVEQRASNGSQPLGFVFADLGRMVDSNRGVRCDGIHFGSEFAAGSSDALAFVGGRRGKHGLCRHSLGAWDATIAEVVAQACDAQW